MEILSNLFYEVKVTLILRLKKDITRKEITNHIPHNHRYKNPSNFLANQMQQYIKWMIQHDQVVLFQKCKIGLIFKSQSMEHE